MSFVKIKKINTPVSGVLSFPGDKSLSHRAIIFGSLADGVSRFTNVLSGEDCVCTRQAFEAMGVAIKTISPTEVEIKGTGLQGLKAPKNEIYLGNSGTSIRLLMGILAGQNFKATLTGDPSLSHRPMRRVTDYLKQMGAKIEGRDNANYAPLTVEGASLKAIDAKLAISSAQVKSAILLAGLYAKGKTSVTEPVKSRDHSERFLSHFGAKVEISGNTVSVQGGQKLSAKSFEIAGDISSAAFFMAIALLVPDTTIQFKSVLDNPTRTGLLEVLKRMGVNFSGYQSSAKGSMAGPEPVADFGLHTQSLKAFEIKREELPSLIDEIPILMVLATQAKGVSIIHEAKELRVKETDRIHSMTTTLSAMGASIQVEGDTIFITGGTPLKGAKLNSFKDHRTAMSLIVAGMVADGETIVEDLDCINTSFPNFFGLLNQLQIPYQLSK